jgi:hypothetical protein
MRHFLPDPFQHFSMSFSIFSIALEPFWLSFQACLSPLPQPVTTLPELRSTTNTNGLTNNTPLHTSRKELFS